MRATAYALVPVSKFYNFFFWLKIIAIAVVCAALVSSPFDIFGLNAKEEVVILKAELAASSAWEKALMEDNYRKVEEVTYQKALLEEQQRVAEEQKKRHAQQLAKKEAAIRLYALATARYAEAQAKQKYYEATLEVARLNEKKKSAWEKAKDAFNTGYQEAYTGVKESKTAVAKSLDLKTQQARVALEKAKIQMNEQLIHLAEETSNALK